MGRQIEEVTIAALGSAGDGLALVDGRTVFVPGSLPGETIRLAMTPGSPPEIVEVLAASPARVTPPCSLFGTCGGCTMQMMRLDALADWKAERVLSALRQAGFPHPPGARVTQTPEHSRRRVDLGVQRVSGGVVIGLHRRHGAPVDMTECRVAVPDLLALLPSLRQTLAGLGALTRDATVQINFLTSGPDVVVSTPQALVLSDRQKLVDFATRHAIPRLSWFPAGRPREVETLSQIAPVTQSFGPLAVVPPPAAFLQATRDGEAAITAAVLGALPPLNRKDEIVELYAGCGTLTGPLTERGRVTAYEGSADALSALKRARVGHRLEAHHRDLERQPLLVRELASARVVVLDPPYGGATRQIEEVARSGVKDVVYVSCNPKALERDARVLRQAGFGIIGLDIIDQFLWSADVEAVVSFSRDPKRIRKAASPQPHSPSMREGSTTMSVVSPS